MEHETLWQLLCDPAHWELEIIIQIVFDGLIGLIVWPRLCKAVLHHRSDDEKLADLQTQIDAIKARLEGR
jgi:hypothetical protein